MSETVEPTVVEESELTSNSEPTVKEVIEEKLPKFTTKEEIDSAYKEIEMLTSLINTTYHSPKYDNGNNGKAQPKITGSTTLSFYGPAHLNKWYNRIIELTERL